jgi:ABC-type branched-subunit amino acid transport system substrate-binding protein
MGTDPGRSPYRRTRGRTIAGILMIGVLALVSCKSDSNKAAGTASSGAASSGLDATGPAPGVTADSMKIGITYPDAKSLEAVGLHYNLGDFEAAYNAIADDINSKGGINGRKLQLVFAPINPTSAEPADAACVKLTEDDQVFLIAGFFLNDAPLCPLERENTAVVGGGMTPERLARAKEPWVTPLVDTDLPEAVTAKFIDKNLLGGKVATFAAVGDKEELDNHVTKVLNDHGIQPVATGIMDAPDNDPTAVQNSVKASAERFKAAGADTVLIAGASGQDWPMAMADDTSYRPKLLFVDSIAVQAFATNAATTDTSVLNGSVAGGIYGPDPAIFAEPQMQKCVGVIKAKGTDVPAPVEGSTDMSNQPYQAAFAACPHMALVKAWLDAAGKNLNYGTLNAALTHGFQVNIPGDPAPRTYGPAPKADGDPAAYLFNWDQSKKTLVIQNG